MTDVGGRGEEAKQQCGSYINILIILYVFCNPTIQRNTLTLTLLLRGDERLPGTLRVELRWAGRLARRRARPSRTP